MLQNYFGILAIFIIAGSVSGLFLLLAEKLGPKNPNAVKNTPFECGKEPFEKPTGRHTVRFYLAGMLFVLFDVEIIFFYPWAVVFRDLGIGAFAAMMIFLVLFELGFLYAWKKGAFEFK